MTIKSYYVVLWGDDETHSSASAKRFTKGRFIFTWCSDIGIKMTYDNYSEDEVAF